MLLQGRLMDEDGYPRKAEAGEDPHNIGLSLEYVFGSFVSTDEMAHVSAKGCLGEQALILSLELNCDLMLSTSQGRTLHGYREHQPNSCMVLCLLQHSS